MTAMTTREIPMQQWAGFFDTLSRAYEGWRTTIELLSPDLGDQPVAQDVLLQGISYETQGTRAGDILVETGDRPDSYLTHTVPRATHVHITDSTPGNEVDIEIESADGPVTLVRLHRMWELPSPKAPHPRAKRSFRPRRRTSGIASAAMFLGSAAALLGIGMLLYRQRQSSSRRLARRASSFFGLDRLRSCP